MTNNPNAKLPFGSSFCQGVYRTDEGHSDALSDRYSNNPSTGFPRGIATRLPIYEEHVDGSTVKKVYFGPAKCSYLEDGKCKVAVTGIRHKLEVAFEDAFTVFDENNELPEDFDEWELFRRDFPLEARFIGEDGFLKMRTFIVDQRDDFDELLNDIAPNVAEVTGECLFGEEKEPTTSAS